MLLVADLTSLLLVPEVTIMANKDSMIMGSFRTHFISNIDLSMWPRKNGTAATKKKSKKKYDWVVMDGSDNGIDVDYFSENKYPTNTHHELNITERKATRIIQYLKFVWTI